MILIPDCTLHIIGTIFIRNLSVTPCFIIQNNPNFKMGVDAFFRLYIEFNFARQYRSIEQTDKPLLYCTHLNPSIPVALADIPSG